MASVEENWSPNGRLATRETPVLRTVSKPQEVSVAKIPEGCRISGTVELVGLVQIDGEVEGDLVSTGQIIVGETGVINANIATYRIKVFGQINGDIIAQESLEFCARACVKGNICSPKVIIQDGVVFEGRCIMPNPEARSLNNNIVSIKKDEQQQSLPFAKTSTGDQTIWKRSE